MGVRAHIDARACAGHWRRATGRVPLGGRNARGGHGLTRRGAEPANVLIADDHAPTRDDVRRALERGGGFTVCAEAGDASEAVQAALREQPDICLLDVCMPGSGVGAAWEI